MTSEYCGGPWVRRFILTCRTGRGILEVSLFPEGGPLGHERTETLAVPRRIWAHVRFNYDGDTQAALWRRMWLYEREKGCHIASLVCIAAGFIAGPLAAQLLGPTKWYSSWVCIGILLLCFCRSVVMHRHSLRYRRLLRAVEGEYPARWQEIDDALADVQRSVQEDDPKVMIHVSRPP